jgi:hypothetical protein
MFFFVAISYYALVGPNCNIVPLYLANVATNIDYIHNIHNKIWCLYILRMLPKSINCIHGGTQIF